MTNMRYFTIGILIGVLAMMFADKCSADTDHTRPVATRTITPSSVFGVVDIRTPAGTQHMESVARILVLSDFIVIVHHDGRQVVLPNSTILAIEVK